MDPNETWREFFSSMIEFRDPKIVPLGSLPEEFDPKERRWERVKSLVNWRNKNYLEGRK